MPVRIVVYRGNHASVTYCPHGAVPEKVAALSAAPRVTRIHFPGGYRFR